MVQGRVAMVMRHATITWTKHLMIRSFILKAGIPADQQIVIYDHEAASVCCQYMEAQIPGTNSQPIGFDSDKTEYIVVKLAGIH